MSKFKKVSAVVATFVVMSFLSGCAMFGNFGEEVSRNFNGVNATMRTYNQSGQVIDQVSGKSFKVSRDDRFDTTDSEGKSNEDSGVLLISVGDNHISHVGSTMVMAQEGLTDVYQANKGTVSLENNKSGTPFLNNFIEKNRNLWQGKSKTIMIRSQDGDPVAIFAGEHVEVFATDVPKSTQFRVDGKYLFVYRADYTVYDTDMLN